MYIDVQKKKQKKNIFQDKKIVSNDNIFAQIKNVLKGPVCEIISPLDVAVFHCMDTKTNWQHAVASSVASTKIRMQQISCDHRWYIYIFF